MSFHVEQGGPELLEAYARTPIAFQVTSIFEVRPIHAGLGEINRYGYYNVPAVRHETMLIWYYTLHETTL